MQLQREMTLPHLARLYPFHVKQAETKFAEVRARLGFKSKGTLLSGDISKLNKDGSAILGLALLPASTSDIANLCAFADSCENTCVAFSGNGGWSKTQKSRLARTVLLTEHPKEFLTLLLSELFTALDNRADRTQKLNVRLNTYSDIRWEQIARWMFLMFMESINFYDYTKHPMRSRPISKMPANYHLTYSVSERTTKAQLRETLKANRPIAVVVSIRSGVQPSTGEMKPIPTTWANRPTVDGDATDRRWETKTGEVVILRRKHTMRENHPMILAAQQLEKEVSK